MTVSLADARLITAVAPPLSEIPDDIAFEDDTYWAGARLRADGASQGGVARCGGPQGHRRGGVADRAPPAGERNDSCSGRLLADR